MNTQYDTYLVVYGSVNGGGQTSTEVTANSHDSAAIKVLSQEPNIFIIATQLINK